MEVNQLFIKENIEKKHRCFECEYRHIVHSLDNHSFYGCYHAPYKGKRVSEIKECPKDNKGE